MKRITMVAFVGVLAYAILAMGCLDRKPAPVCPVPTEIASNEQTASDFDGVDIVVVVDNSGSMAEEQNILSTGFYTLVNSLIQPLSPENDPDWGFPAVDNLRVAIVTSDNPRMEQPEAIIADILTGLVEEGGELKTDAEGQGCLVMADRGEAIAASIAAVRPGDTILVAGKGHEDYQILGTTKIHFDDREEARAMLALGGGTDG